MDSSGKDRVDPANPHRLNLLQGMLARYRKPKYLLIFALVLAGYFVTGTLGLALSVPLPGSTPVWLPAGISLAVVLLLGNWIWPAIFLGAFLVNINNGVAVAAALGIAVSSTGEALLAAYLVKRYANGKSAFFASRDTLKFLFLAGVLGPSLCASLGTLLLTFDGHLGWRMFWLNWRIWWIGDALGILLLTPFLVLLLGHAHHALSGTDLVEIVLLLLALCVVCVLNFGPPLISWMPRSGLHYLCVPILAWIAVRYCPLEASGAALLMGGFAMWGSLHGYGLFAHAGGMPFLGAGYVLVLSATTLGVAATIAEHKRSLENTLHAYYLLKSRIEQETALRPEPPAQITDKYSVNPPRPMGH
ncbi:MAG TPA: MASE1 domain-containing protein [Terriglobales bacterium]|nr:MASE1 domain-containing protein [Terriglobales bacterium]